VIQVVESLSNKHEALSSIPSLEGRKKEKKRKEGGKEGRKELSYREIG
jgi:hypothetical protein